MRWQIRLKRAAGFPNLKSRRTKENGEARRGRACYPQPPTPHNKVIEMSRRDTCDAPASLAPRIRRRMHGPHTALRLRLNRGLWTVNVGHTFEKRAAARGGPGGGAQVHGPGPSFSCELWRKKGPDAVALDSTPLRVRSPPREEGAKSVGGRYLFARVLGVSGHPACCAASID